jgi:hypothetical protein
MARADGYVEPDPEAVRFSVNAQGPLRQAGIVQQALAGNMNPDACHWRKHATDNGAEALPACTGYLLAVIAATLAVACRVSRPRWRVCDRPAARLAHAHHSFVNLDDLVPVLEGGLAVALFVCRYERAVADDAARLRTPRSGTKRWLGVANLLAFSGFPIQSSCAPPG